MIVLISFSVQLRITSAEQTLSRIARKRTLGGIATYPRSQLHEIDEDVRLAAQIVGDHRRLA
jgi:hypothetical protein